MKEVKKIRFNHCLLLGFSAISYLRCPYITSPIHLAVLDAPFILEEPNQDAFANCHYHLTFIGEFDLLPAF